MPPKIESYIDLVVYQIAYKMTIDVYRVTRKYPPDERWGLISQMRRSAVSVPSNIAEGYRRGHRREYIQFLHIAQGSCGELETLLSLSKDLGYLVKTDFDALYEASESIGRLLNKLIKSLSGTNERS